ncbi:hypothetical protein DFP72DRAFT_538170 [Ephemerocybe angulata]|uniref:Nephrocystin 3-like N-terminal domain-containing protein n=1 Tax=Ephemerocybe angulata TaxID=980116 RepID=A0A8H6M182_9AGAR|nr:hypothetical protein DFP72DRAFT_538170 [Tulosesus angulatus]
MATPQSVQTSTIRVIDRTCYLSIGRQREEERLRGLRPSAALFSRLPLNLPRPSSPTFNPSTVSVGHIENGVLGDNYGHIAQQSSYESERDSFKDAINNLVKNMESSSVHDASERSDAPKCMPNTRVKVQEEIMSWIHNGGRKQRGIMWVTGPAGTGKSAVLGSIADTCKMKGLLAGSFCFSPTPHSDERTTKKRLVATLAYQLQEHEGLPDVRRRILSSIDRRPAIFTKNLKEQFSELILNPLREIKQRGPGGSGGAVVPKVIVIDGLDECVAEQYCDSTGDLRAAARPKEGDQREILSVLLRAAKDDTFPFCILLGSRPENAIRHFFTSPDAQDVTQELFLGEQYDPDADITLFYETKLSVVREKFELPETWPAPHEKTTLVKNASGQFVYADTAMRIIEGAPKSGANNSFSLGTPCHRLKRILASGLSVEGSEPLETLDALYTSVLSTCPEPSLTMKWLRAIRGLKVLSSDSPSGEKDAPPWLVRLILESYPGEERHALGALASLLYVPPSTRRSRELGRAYSFYHKAFLDFIQSRDRCGGLYVSTTEAEDFINLRYFQTLKNHFERIVTRKDFVYMRMEYQSGKMFCFSSKKAFKEAQDALLACDVRQWTWFVANSHYAYGGHYIIRMFYAVHQWCPWYQPCRPACNHWRQNMLSVLTASGWKVPTAQQLLQNRFSDDVLYDFHPAGISSRRRS